MYSKTLVAIFGVAFFATLANAQATGTQDGAGTIGGTPTGQESDLVPSATGTGSAAAGGASDSSALGGASSSVSGASASSSLGSSPALSSTAAASGAASSSPASLSSASASTSGQGIMSSLRSRVSSMVGTGTSTEAASAGASLTGDLPNSVFLQASALGALFVTSFVVLLA
ncbi:hypothetical protein VTP01DRAFT_5653 [Rhizomucor pusillus]|uniref:uncharacterized protein n=1 Tax=Rhizomucor pusillus TaxID=4840 RepID=UPI003743D081